MISFSIYDYLGPFDFEMKTQSSRGYTQAEVMDYGPDILYSNSTTNSYSTLMFITSNLKTPVLVIKAMMFP